MILKIEWTGHPKSSTQRSNSYSTLAPSITNSLAGRSLKVTLPNSSSGTAVSVMANGWLCPWFFYNTKKKWLTNFYHQHKYYTYVLVTKSYRFSDHWMNKSYLVSSPKKVFIAMLNSIFRLNVHNISVCPSRELHSTPSSACFTLQREYRG